MPKKPPDNSNVINETQEANPDATAGFGLLIILAGLALTCWAVLGNADQFPHGPWPAILVGACFNLCGFQLFCSALRRATGAETSSIIALVGYAGNCAMFCWAAFSPRVVFLDAHHQPTPDLLTSHLACAFLALICAIGIATSISRLTARPN